MKKSVYLILFLYFFGYTSILIAQTNYGGIIYFEDGNRILFKNIELFEVQIGEVTNKIPDALPVLFNDQLLHLSYSEIKQIDIESYEIWDGDFCKNATLKILLKDRSSIESNYTLLNYLINVTTYDDETGREKLVNAITFGKEDKLNIRKIVFD